MTTITDDFTRADADALGTSSEGWSWTEVVGDFDIVSNQCRATSGTSALAGAARAETDLASDDQYAQLDIIADGGAGNRLAVAIVRFASAEETYYRFLVRTSDGFNQIQKNVNGSLTNLVTGTTTALSLPDTMKFTASDTALEGFINAVSVASVSDASISGNTRCGLGGNASVSVDMDNFEAADLGGGAVTKRRYTLTTMGVG